MLVVSAGAGHVASAVMQGLAGAPGRKRHVSLKGGSGCSPGGFENVPIGAGLPADRLRVLEGVSKLVLLPTYDRAMVEAQVALIAMAKSAGVNSIYLISLDGAEVTSPVTLLRWCGLVERAVVASGVRYARLRCAPFVQNLRLFTEREGSGYALVGPFRAAAFPWIDARDVGEIIVSMMRAGLDQNLSFSFAGTEAVDFDAISRMLAEASGRAVRFIDALVPQAVGHLEARGLSAIRIRVITEYWDFLVSGIIQSTRCDAIYRHLCHPPRRVGAFIDELALQMRAAV